MPYITTDVLRAEGVPDTVSDELLESRIRDAEAKIEAWTGRFFEPRDLVYRLDGSGTPIQPLPDPAISVSSVVVYDLSPTESGGGVTLEPGDYVVYNRHIYGQLNPDDREAPAVKVDGSGTFGRGPARFPPGHENVQITGVWGYTDPVPGSITTGVVEPFVLADGQTVEVAVDGGDAQVVTLSAANFVDIAAATAAELAAVIRAGIIGATVYSQSGRVTIRSRTSGVLSSVEVTGTAPLAWPPGPQGYPEGVTPYLIARAVTLMVVRDLALLSETDDRDEENRAFRVESYRTRDQTVTFASRASGSLEHQYTGFFTGEPEIDNIIAQFVRPPSLGFVGGIDPDLPERYYDYPRMGYGRDYWRF